jgi:hypothetical protein
VWPAKKVVVSGLLLYLLGFAPPAVKHTPALSGSEPGFMCALFALAKPWDHENLASTRDGLLPALGWFSLLLSGWINPLFLVAVLCHRWSRIFQARIVPLAMFPACWFYFHFGDFSPREGYFLWVAGMVLAIFSAGKHGSRIHVGCSQENCPATRNGGLRQGQVWRLAWRATSH